MPEEYSNSGSTSLPPGISPRNDTAKVRVSVPYPTVLEGTPSEEGISEEALKLISDIVNKDVANGFSSASLAVIRNGRLVYQNAWGRVSSYEQDGRARTDSPMATTDTLYDLASVTKMFSVNYAVQKLVSDGVMSVNDRICDYLGDGFWQNVVSVNYRGRAQTSIDTQKQWKKNLTIRDILCHQGGFPADPKYFNPNVNQATQAIGAAGANVLFSGNSADEVSKAETLRQILRTPLMYEPGTETLYSDVDYMILGFVIEKVTGKDLDTYLKDTFFNPMGLKRITYNPLKHGFGPDDCAATELNGNTRDGVINFPGIRTYTLQGEVHDEKAWYCMGGVSGHAGLFSNAADLAKLATCMLTGGYGNLRFFSRNVIDEFTAPKSENFPTWGLGWWREADSQRAWYFGTQSSSDTVGHQGWTGTLAMIDPSRDLVVVYLTNKINSRLTDPKKSTSRFDSAQYTSATLGFVPQILSIGMDADPSFDVKEQLLDLCADLASEGVKLIPKGAERGNPYALSAKSKIELLRDRAKAAGNTGYESLADELMSEIEYLLPVKETLPDASGNDAVPGDASFDAYVPELSDRKVAVFTNHTGIVGDDISKSEHIVDALIKRGVNVTSIFAPEHGFRGKLDAGAAVSDSVDPDTGLPVYGTGGILKNSDLDSIMASFDTLIVDIQDVGVRFFTYHITMFELMEACAARGKKVIVLDRPDPNGFFVDGPILNEAFASNVGRLKVPVVYGLTLGELALMINGEGWLSTGRNSCKLTVVPCTCYKHSDRYALKVNPSPNLKSERAVWLYPSTCYFENTQVSSGRGTEKPFEVFISPYLPDNAYYGFTVTPVDMEGAMNPPFEGKLCVGRDLSFTPYEDIWDKGIDLSYLIKAYSDVTSLHPELSFWGKEYNGGRYWIDYLFGTDSVRKQIEAGASAEAIKDSWQDDLDGFRVLRRKYLLYPEE